MYLMIVLGVLGWPGIEGLSAARFYLCEEQEFYDCGGGNGTESGRKIFPPPYPQRYASAYRHATMDSAA